MAAPPTSRWTSARARLGGGLPAAVRRASATPTGAARGTRSSSRASSTARAPRRLASCRGRARRGRAAPAPRRATAERARDELDAGLARYAPRGHLAAPPRRRPRYAFIHGNWCLANARRGRQGLRRRRGAGAAVRDRLLRRLHVPVGARSRPSPNSSTRSTGPTGDLARKRALRAGRARARRRVMTIAAHDRPGRSRSLRRGEVPGCDRERRASRPTIRRPPARVATLGAAEHPRRGPPRVGLREGPHPRRAGARRPGACSGEQAASCTSTLAREYNDGQRWELHYVTAREMFNIAIAAMDGQRGLPRFLAELPSLRRPRSAGKVILSSALPRQRDAARLDRSTAFRARPPGRRGAAPRPAPGTAPG